ncbi:AMP-binding protein [Mycobacterium sp. URHB0021]|jgi:acyl-CoA synthetase (AMP-forming)/AMP-acid ligase II
MREVALEHPVHVSNIHVEPIRTTVRPPRRGACGPDRVSATASRQASLFCGEAGNLAAYLAITGLLSHARLGIYLNNRGEILEALDAVLGAGAVVIPMNPSDSAPERQCQLADLGGDRVTADSDSLPHVIPALRKRRLPVHAMDGDEVAAVRDICVEALDLECAASTSPGAGSAT